MSLPRLLLPLAFLAASTPSFKTGRVTSAEVERVAALGKVEGCSKQRVLLDQSFSLTAAGSPHDGSLLLALVCSDQGPEKLKLVEVKAGAIRQVLDDHPANQWALDSVDAVAFKDVNGDGLPDLVVVASSITGVGPTGMEPFATIGVWLGTPGGSWHLDPTANDLAQELSDRTLKAALPALEQHYRAAKTEAAGARPAPATAASLPPTGCAEPKSLKLLAPAELVTLLATDPIDGTRDWTRPESGTRMRANGITYNVDDQGSVQGSVVASKAGKPIFHIEGRQVAGGTIGASLSPRGTLLAITYGRGGVSLYDAATGKAVATAGVVGWALAPDESYLVIPPVEGAMSLSFETTDLEVVRLGTKPTTTAVASWKLAVKDGDAPSDFGVAICPTGALFAASHPRGELAVYRASDLKKLASVATSARGAPAFTRSGRYLVVGQGDEHPELYELVP